MNSNTCIFQIEILFLFRMPQPARQRPGPVQGHSQQSGPPGHGRSVSRPHDNVGPHGQKKDSDIGELLRDTETYFKNQDPDTRPNSRLDSPQFTKNSLYNKLDMIFQAKKPGLIELEMMETFRAWIEDQKGDDYHRFQTFEFIFATAVSRILIFKGRVVRSKIPKTIKCCKKTFLVERSRSV